MLSEATYATSVVGCVCSLTITLIGSAGSEQSKLEACKLDCQIRFLVGVLPIANCQLESSGYSLYAPAAGDLPSRRITLEAACDIRTRPVAVRCIEGA